MGLSRLENFLRAIKGTIIYVDPNALDATDSIENTGTSPTRPFRTLQRALVEAARYSYLPGQNNDKFGNTSIVLYPGDHLIDNRPGLIPNGSSFLFRNGTITSNFDQFSLRTNFDVTADNNDLYKLNSVHGGVIVPRGTSIVGMDLRKTKIRPKYVPDPTDDTIDHSAIFRLTGACYLWQFSVFDADPNGQCFTNYTNLKLVPNFSHHKLTAFEYADGINNVALDGVGTFERTDLEMYYEKISIAYGDSSGRKIEPTYPATIDIQPKIDEYRIVGSKGIQIGITSITASNSKITVTLDNDFEDVQVDTPIRIDGVSVAGYNGQYVVSSVLAANKIQYNVSETPIIANGGSGGTLSVVADTVTSASPYVFNISLRSVYGMSGLHADGSKADGFKSIVVAQFTGISLQKDNNAFVKYNPATGLYEDRTTSSTVNLYSDSLARYKQGYVNYHVKASNGAIIQAVSIFAIGYAEQFVAESGGDQSITNSNSNFGAKSLVSKGYNVNAFTRDDVGYITHVIPPQKIPTEQTSNFPYIEFDAIDATKTLSVASSNRLYLYNQTNQSNRPSNIIDGYRIGAKPSDTLNVLISGQEYGAPIVMQGISLQTDYEKVYKVKKKANGINNEINSNTITLTGNHDFINGESIRIISSNGSLPNGIEHNKIYYVITNTTLSVLGANQIKLAKTYNDALNGANSSSDIDLYSLETGNLKVISRVSDKNSGEVGHPVQWDSTNNQWYIQVTSANQIYTKLLSAGISVTARTYIKRIVDTRGLNDRIFKFRYVIPKDSTIKGRPPLDGYVVQESTSNNLPSLSELSAQFNIDSSTISNSDSIKNPRIISNASYSGETATITTELPHNLSIGSQVEINQIISSSNLTGLDNSGYNGTYTVISIPNSLQFTYNKTPNPGTFLNLVSLRDKNLPHFSRKKYKETYYIYRSEQIQEYIKDKQDGIYHIILVNSSNSPTVSEFSDLKFSQPIQNLYPQENRDNLDSDPKSSVSYALPEPVGQVVIDNPQNSITKETFEKFVSDHKIGFGVTDIRSSSTGTAHTFYTNIDHGLNGISGLTIISSGAGYGSGAGADLYNARLVGFAGSTVGENATALIRVNATGQITNIKIINPGSAYGVGNTLSVVGVATTNSHVVGVVSVNAIVNSANDIVTIDGIKEDNYTQYNNLYRITGISSSRAIQVASASTITPVPTAGISTEVNTNSIISQLGPKALLVSSLTHQTGSRSGILTTTTAHGLRINSKVRLFDPTNQRYNDDFIVNKINSVFSFNVNLGFTTTSQLDKGTFYAYTHTYSSNSGSISKEEEKNTSRIIPTYSGISATLSSGVSISSSTISITNATTTGLKIGDFIIIDNEILKIKQTITSNIVSVIRGVLGSPIETHSLSSVVRKISPVPIELRRHSILRASGHTFEYVGFGPGNYSTALPESQDRQISPREELLSQSFKTDGGINVFTGMNNDGDFYIGNKKVSSATGQEEVYDAPIPTVTGEDTVDRFDISNPIEINVTRSIQVEGGPNKEVISKFDGPVIFNNKITSTSEKGIEANSIFIQGSSEVSRKISIGNTVPVVIGNTGDIDFNTVPNNGENAGWIFTNQNEWRRFGPIQNSNGHYSGIWSGTHYGTYYGDGSGLSGLDPVWKTSPTGIHTSSNVGIGTTQASSTHKLEVIGSTNINGILNVGEIIERITVDTSTVLGSTVTVASPLNINLNDNNVYYYTISAVGNWAINFISSNLQSLNEFMKVGETLTVAVMTTQGGTAFYNPSVLIDNTSINVFEYGDLPITEGNPNGIDMYTYVIIKKSNSGTISDRFTVLRSLSQYTQQ
jgi:hypothetical protein